MGAATRAVDSSHVAKRPVPLNSYRVDDSWQHTSSPMYHPAIEGVARAIRVPFVRMELRGKSNTVERPGDSVGR